MKAAISSGVLETGSSPMLTMRSFRSPDCRAFWISADRRTRTSRGVPAEIQKALQSGDLKDRMVNIGLDPVSSTPDEMAAFMRREQERYAAIIKAANIRLE